MEIQRPPGFNVQELADRCGIHPNSMYRALNDFDENGVHNCGTERAKAIHRASLAMGFLIPCWVLRHF